MSATNEPGRLRRTLPDGRTLLIVVPAYNEQASVGAVVRSLYDHGPSCDVLVIDDGSIDSTAARARAAGATVIRLPYNLGIGGAVQTGFVYARENHYDLMAQVDADGQHDPAELYKLVKAIDSDNGYDMACGTRFLTDEFEYHAPASRRAGIRFFAFALSLMLGQRITDPTSGFRVFNRRTIALFARDYPHDYPEVEAVLMLHANRLRLTEIPVQMHPRDHGRSSIDALGSAYYMIKVSLALVAGVLRRRPKLEISEAVTVPPVSLMHVREQIASIVLSGAGLLLVFELVRRRRLGERYALLWMGVAIALLVLAIWQGLLYRISRIVGIYSPTNALFAVAFGFALLLLLHFSAAISRGNDQQRILAQRVAILEQRIRELEETGDPVTAQASTQEAADGAPV